MRGIVLTFISAFIQVFLIAIQTKNIADSNYTLAFFTSIGISASWIFNANSVVRKGRAEKIAYGGGSATGVVIAIVTYNFMAGTL